MEDEYRIRARADVIRSFLETSFVLDNALQILDSVRVRASDDRLGADNFIPRF